MQIEGRRLKIGVSEQTLDGGQHLVGSTTQLTVRGFSDFLEQVFAFGSSLGVQFSANPNEGKL